MPKPPTQRVPLLTVTERPEGMTFEAYKLLQRQQDRALRAYKRGQLHHDSRTGTYRNPSTPTT